MRSSRLRYLAGALLLVGLAACTSRPVITGTGAEASWSLNGRLGYIAGKEHGNLSVDWRQRPDHFEINLLGPLGVGVARVEGEPGRVVLDMAGRDPVVARSADDLVEQVIGVALPVSQLRYWVRGKPAPLPHQSTADGFRQLGWQIAYLQYEQQLPVKIRLTRPGVKVMMVVKKWAN